MSILDAALHYGSPESPYGTAATLTRSYEAQSDPWNRKMSYLESAGMRAGLQAVRSDRSTAILMGAEGSIEVDFLNKGMGLMLKDLFGNTTGPTLVSGITYDQVHTTTKDGPSTSSTVQLVRPFVDGSSQAFTYTGCVCTGWELTAEVDKYLRLKADFNAKNEDTGVAAGSANYPAAPNPPFDWTMVSTSTVGGTPIDFSKISLKADYKMNTDRRFMKSGSANAQQKQPRVGGVPQYTGALQAEFASLAEYNRFTAGTVVAAQFIWTGALIEAGKNFALTVDLAAIQYTGETPDISLSELPQQPLPFKVLHDGTNPAVKFTIRSSDSAL
jgi:hypothetical protein